jgi:DNA processing protein
MPARSPEEILYWLALRLTPGLGARKMAELLAHFGSPAAIFRATTADLESAGLNPSVARSLASGCAFEDAAGQHERLRQTGATLIALADPAYPARLAEIFDPPPLLYALGRLELAAAIKIAIVGSRRASAYGVAVAERLATELAALGVTVVSGMARGIDTAAHVGALSSPQAGTIAVFGCGLDVIYPAENRRLAERIAKEGLILTEFPLGQPAHPQNFPIRNRIVSGLCEGVVVVEGEQYSGSLITARLALDQNREVFAVPGNITNKLSFGPNLLIKQGAQLVQSATDIIDNLSWEARSALARQARLPLEPAAPPEPTSPMAAVEQQVLAALRPDQPTQLDTLMEQLLDISSSELIAALFELELQGRARQLPGRCYVKVWSE